MKGFMQCSRSRGHRKSDLLLSPSVILHLSSFILHPSSFAAVVSLLFWAVIPAMNAAAQEEPKPSSRPRASGRGPALPPGQWVDLLKSVDVKRRGVAGKWQLREKELAVSAVDASARLPLAAAPRGAYEVKLEFTRTDGDGTVGVILPVGSRQCLVAVNFGGGPSGIDMIDGRRANENTSAFPGALANDRRYTLEIAVQADQEEASVTANLDGRPLVFYRGPTASLSLNKEWAIPSRSGLGLVAQADVVFHRFEVRTKAGKPAAE
jgi:hypothetical protein